MKSEFTVVRGPLPKGVRLEENVYVTMRDGVKIAVDVYLPETQGRYPAILSMSPYMKEIQQAPPQLSHSIEAGATWFFVPKGYIHVIAQIRGTGFSQGQYNFCDIKEQQDGYDLVEWIAQQPWCDGNVGMIGDSYFGFSQYLVAAQNPPHLKCITPFDAWTDFYRDPFYKGGILWSTMTNTWGVDTTFQCVWPGPIEGKLPPANFSVDLASHPNDGPYYWERSAWPKLDTIKVPMLGIVPLTPQHSRGQLLSYPDIKTTKKLLVVPRPGRLANALFVLSKPLNEHILRWLDHWLKGKDTGIMDEPEITIFDSGTSQWRYENEYPLARTQWREFYLHAKPSPSDPHGLMSNTAPQEAEKPDKYTNPDHELMHADKPGLTHTTAPLSEDVRVYGPLSALLYGSSTTLDTAWFVKVGDVAPDGTVSLLTESPLKASHREVDKSKSRPGQPYHPFQNPVLPEPNTVYKYEIEMMPIFHTFKKGHKIWFQVASYDLTFQTFLHTLYTYEGLPLPGENTIYHDAEHPSHLLLPVIPDAPEIKPVGPPVSEITWPL
jgi:predicted acyl esterase